VRTPLPPAGTLAGYLNRQTGRGIALVRSRTYEITFTGQASPAVGAEFDDCEVSLGPGTTTLRAELPDQCALSGLIQRVIGLHLEIIQVQLV
jgi:hypothetical protein